MIKVDLHTHSGEDPEDGLAYPASALVDRAVALGFGALSVTLHNAVLEDPRLFDYARQRGLLLVRGVEWQSPRGDVLLYNVSQREFERLQTLDDLRFLRRERGNGVLIVAAHPYFIRHSLHRWTERYIEVFDAIEYSHMHFPWLNLNRKAVQVAARYGKPVVANSDAHNLWMFGQHYTLVDADATVESLFAGIRAGRLQLHSPPVNLWFLFRSLVADPLLMRRPGRIIRSFEPGAGQ
ncbi:MAG: PHP domain-containing protein [Verrucomicrobiae bacterium]|nr:PHP domain-containing protein [Verrucomicrobiae bacterium]